jgi:hypothetical protein
LKVTKAFADSVSAKRRLLMDCIRDLHIAEAEQAISLAYIIYTHLLNS